MPRVTTKLTKRYIDSLVCDSGKIETLYWDSDIRGLGVRVTKNGTKTYIVQRYIKGSKQIVRDRIEDTSVISLDEARKRAIEMIATYFSRGLHPRAERKKQAEVAHSNNFTLRQALDEFLANRPKTRPTTKDGYKTTIHRYCRDWLDKPLTGINTDMVLARHTEIHEQVAKRARSSESAGYTAANKTMRSVRAVWNYALAAERIPATTVNPVAKFSRLRKWYPDRPRTEYIPPSGIKAFYEAADALDNRVAATYLKLLLFTGLRNREARSLRWEYIDLEGAMIRLPHTETKAHRHLDLPMSDFVHELLSRWKDTAVSEYVFPGEMRHELLLVSRTHG